MFEILIDTNIYRKDPAQVGLAFKAVARLCKANAARLHIPYVVLREFQTQQVDLYGKEMQAAFKNITNVLNRRLSVDTRTKLGEIKSAVEALIPTVNHDAANGIVKWAQELGAVIYPLDPAEASRAMEAYFNGELPLKEPKVRKDIPDSFIFQAALGIRASADKLYVISEDGAFAEAAATVDGMHVLKSLNDFVELPQVQASLQKQDEAEKIAFVIEKLKTVVEELDFPVVRSVGERIMWKKIHSRDIPDDNHEATICSYDYPENIAIDFTEAAYYGDGQLGLPFSCAINVSAIYYIFKSDFYALDEEDMPSVSDHNDHYFEAESEFEVIVQGTISLNVQLDKVADDKEIEEYLDFYSAEIDEIDSIELAES